MNKRITTISGQSVVFSAPAAEKPTEIKPDAIVDEKDIEEDSCDDESCRGCRGL